MTEQHLPSYQRDLNSEVEQFRDIAARFKRAARHCFKSKVQRFIDIVERLEDSTEEKVRLYSIRRWRTARIERFTKIQRDKREMINLAEIAECCSEESGVVPNEVARETAYEKLLADVLEGDFEKNGVSQIMYLHPYTSKTRMTREWMTGLLEFKNVDRATIISQYLAHCWMPRVFSERRFAKHRMGTSSTAVRTEKTNTIYDSPAIRHAGSQHRHPASPYCERAFAEKAIWSRARHAPALRG
jgi:hypothetical protein